MVQKRFGTLQRWGCSTDHNAAVHYFCFESTRRPRSAPTQGAHCLGEQTCWSSTGVAQLGWAETGQQVQQTSTASPSIPSPLPVFPASFPSPSDQRLQHNCNSSTQPANVPYPSPPPAKLHLHKPVFVSDDSPVFSLYLSTCRLFLQSLSGQPQSKRQNQLLWHALNAN